MAVSCEDLIQSPFPVVRTSFLAALAHVLPHYIGGVSTWAVSKSPRDARTSTEGMFTSFWHVLLRLLDCPCTSDRKAVQTADGVQTLSSVFRRIGGPQSFVMLLPELRWFDGAGGRGPFLHTSVSQWIRLFCPIPRPWWCQAELPSHQKKRKLLLASLIPSPGCRRSFSGQ